VTISVISDRPYNNPLTVTRYSSLYERPIRYTDAYVPYQVRLSGWGLIEIELRSARPMSRRTGEWGNKLWFWQWQTLNVSFLLSNLLQLLTQLRLPWLLATSRRAGDLLQAAQSWGRSSSPGGGWEFSLLHVVQTGSKARPTFYPLGTGGSYPGSKAAEAWSWQLTSN
jgi:hypothetical protein